MYPSKNDLAATFFLDDVPGASIPANRLNGILERVNERLSLTLFWHLKLTRLLWSYSVSIYS